jgi:hypothetical protein
MRSIVSRRLVPHFEKPGFEEKAGFLTFCIVAGKGFPLERLSFLHAVGRSRFVTLVGRTR